MNDFVWSEALSLGINKIDQDHRRIIEYMNKLSQCVENHVSRSEMEGAFTRLIDFTKKHFSEEETYMESMGYPRLKSHKLIHANLLQELDNHYNSFRKSGEVNEPVFRFLAFWLKSHICGIDKQYAAHAVAA